MYQDRNNRIDRDDWRTIIASILFSKTAVAPFAIAPFLIGGYIDHLGLSTAQASQTLSVEIFALAISNALAFFWISRAACRVWAQRLLFTLIALNISCIYTPGFEVLLVQRALVGAAEGSLLALGFGLLGNTRRPNRNFGLYFAVSLSVGAINIQILPLFLDTAGVTGLFINLSLYAVISLAGSVWAQKVSISEVNLTEEDAKRATTTSAGINFPLLPLGFLLLANYVYFIGQGGVWSFLERLGLQQQLELTGIANALAISLFAGVAGGFTASWLDLKLGRIIPLLLAIAFAVASIFILWWTQGVVAFTLAACLFNYGNNLGHPYVLGFAAKIDKSARLTVLSGALHTGGQATGPLVAGMLVVSPDFTNVLWLGLGAFLMTVVLFVPVAVLARK
ncbi:MAG: hypothetical protein H6995_14310 [Pseudomonadales bacterium]|nr:hypothetical protein [Pseudomonadales bacterium]MCP5216173.1 hypothetical protein [Pseudomonadales bacterium]